MVSRILTLSAALLVSGAVAADVREEDRFTYPCRREF